MMTKKRSMMKMTMMATKTRTGRVAEMRRAVIMKTKTRTVRREKMRKIM
jgi:hypothetical protein